MDSQPPMDMSSSGMGMPAQQGKGMMSMAGGVLILVSGILGLLMWVFFTLLVVGGTSAILPIPGFPAGMAGSLATFLLVCGLIGLVFSIIAIVGGVMGIRRKMWGLSLVGGIFGLLAIGYLLGSLLGLIGLILVAVSKKDFQ